MQLMEEMELLPKERHKLDLRNCTPSPTCNTWRGLCIKLSLKDMYHTFFPNQVLTLDGNCMAS